MPHKVAEHYLELSVDELLEDVLRHYEFNVWPKVEAIFASHLNDPNTTGMVLEGSALWPDFASNLDLSKTVAIWLTADDELICQRIHANSQYEAKSRQEQTLIGKFLERTLVYDARMVEAVKRHGFTSVDVTHSDVFELTQMCMSMLGIDKG